MYIYINPELTLVNSGDIMAVRRTECRININRNPAFIGEPVSIRTLALNQLHLLMSFVRMFPFMLILLFTLILSIYIYLIS